MTTAAGSVNVRMQYDNNTIQYQVPIMTCSMLLLLAVVELYQPVVRYTVKIVHSVPLTACANVSEITGRFDPPPCSVPQTDTRKKYVAFYPETMPVAVAW